MDKVEQFVAEWILPINANWFLGFVGIGVILTLVCWVWTCVNYSKSVSVSGGVISLFVTLITIAFIVWIICANKRPLEIETEERLDIKPVTYPNGRVVQMFCVGDTNVVIDDEQCAEIVPRS